MSISDEDRKFIGDAHRKMLEALRLGLQQPVRDIQTLDVRVRAMEEKIEEMCEVFLKKKGDRGRIHIVNPFNPKSN